MHHVEDLRNAAAGRAGLLAQSLTLLFLDLLTREDPGLAAALLIDLEGVIAKHQDGPDPG